jgi:hypothetical protein
MPESSRLALGRAHLRETQDGWVLTVTVNQRAVVAVWAQPPDTNRLDLGSVSMSITPNLVPGETFNVDVVELVIVDEDESEPAG